MGRFCLCGESLSHVPSYLADGLELVVVPRDQRRVIGPGIRKQLGVLILACFVAATCSYVVGGRFLEGIGEAQQTEWPPLRRTTPLPEPHYPEVVVSVSWLAEHLRDESVIVADARPGSAYLAAHIPTAVSLPPNSLPDPLHLNEVLAARGVSDGKRVVCYSDSSFCSDAALLFWLLEVAGGNKVMILEGGTTAWTGAGHILETTDNQPVSGAWEAEPNLDLVASLEYVRRRYGQSGTEIIDTRSKAEWEGGIAMGESALRERRGHIPNSLPVDFRDFLNADGTFLSAPETREIFSRVGPRPATPVRLDWEFVVHGGGVSGDGALGYFLLRRAGVERLRYYPGGWAEWLADSALPVVRVVKAKELMFRLRMEKDRFKADIPSTRFVMFDVRGQRDYDIGHIPCAVNLPGYMFADSLDAVLNRHWPGIDRTQVPVVIYCYGLGCIRSRYCSTLAARRGFRRVERFSGGMEEWGDEGGEVMRTR